MGLNAKYERIGSLEIWYNDLRDHVGDVTSAADMRDQILKIKALYCALYPPGNLHVSSGDAGH